MIYTGEGAHKGCPYGWMTRARTQGGGHPQGVPLRVDDDMIYTGGGRPQGVPLRMDDDMIYTGEGTHKGCPYGWMTT